MGFRYVASLNFHTYFGQCPNDTYILLHIPLHVCPNYPHTGLTTTTTPSVHQMAVVACDRSIARSLACVLGWVGGVVSASESGRLVWYRRLLNKGSNYWNYKIAGLEGFGPYPVFTVVFTGKYRPGKNRFWTPKVGKTGKNTTSV